MRNFGAVATTIYSFRLHFHLLWISGFADEAFRQASAFFANVFDAASVGVDTTYFKGTSFYLMGTPALTGAIRCGSA
jgi:hypothetical protein